MACLAGRHVVPGLGRANARSAGCSGVCPRVRLRATVRPSDSSWLVGAVPETPLSAASPTSPGVAAARV
jgi:hypothetical protein